jgi:hypothetical protein
MKRIYIIFLLILPLYCIGQKDVSTIYSGGVSNLSSGLSNYLGDEVRAKFDDTAYIFFIQISANKKNIRIVKLCLKYLVRIIQCENLFLII